MRIEAGTHVLLQDTGNSELQRKLQAARVAMRVHDYKAAVDLCKEAERLDGMSLAPVMIAAEAHLRLGHPGMCVGAYGRLAKRRDELTAGERQAPAQQLPHVSDHVYLTTLI